MHLRCSCAPFKQMRWRPSYVFFVAAAIVCICIIIGLTFLFIEHRFGGKNNEADASKRNTEKLTQLDLVEWPSAGEESLTSDVVTFLSSSQPQRVDVSEEDGSGNGMNELMIRSIDVPHDAIVDCNIVDAMPKEEEMATVNAMITKNWDENESTTAKTTTIYDDEKRQTTTNNEDRHEESTIVPSDNDNSSESVTNMLTEITSPPHCRSESTTTTTSNTTATTTMITTSTMAIPAAEDDNNYLFQTLFDISPEKVYGERGAMVSVADESKNYAFGESYKLQKQNGRWTTRMKDGRTHTSGRDSLPTKREEMATAAANNHLTDGPLHVDRKLSSYFDSSEIFDEEVDEQSKEFILIDNKPPIVIDGPSSSSSSMSSQVADVNIPNLLDLLLNKIPSLLLPQRRAPSPPKRSAAPLVGHLMPILGANVKDDLLSTQMAKTNNQLVTKRRPSTKRRADGDGTATRVVPADALKMLPIFQLL